MKTLCIILAAVALSGCAARTSSVTPKSREVTLPDYAERAIARYKTPYQTRTDVSRETFARDLLACKERTGKPSEGRSMDASIEMVRNEELCMNSRGWFK